MDVVDQVLRRLERIDELERRRAGRPELLEELRQLVGEAEAWVSAEGDARARDVVEQLRVRREGMR